MRDKLFTLPILIAISISFLIGGCGDDSGSGAEDALTTIEWDEEGWQETRTYDYSGGVISGFTFHRIFEVTGDSGNVHIRATIKERSDSVDIIDEIAATFPVLANIEYEVLVKTKISGLDFCSSDDTDKVIFSSPSAPTTSEIASRPIERPNPVTGIPEYYCPKNYTIESIRLN